MIRFFGWLRRVVGFLTIMAVLILVPMFYYAGQWMQVHDEPRKADYILPLAGDNHRLIYAADLYKQGFAPRILVSLPAQGPRTIMSEMEKKLGYPQFNSKLEYVCSIC